MVVHLSAAPRVLSDSSPLPVAVCFHYAVAYRHPRLAPAVSPGRHPPDGGREGSAAITAVPSRVSTRPPPVSTRRGALRPAIRPPASKVATAAPLPLLQFPPPLLLLLQMAILTARGARRFRRDAAGERRGDTLYLAGCNATLTQLAPHPASGAVEQSCRLRQRQAPMHVCTSVNPNLLFCCHRRR